MSGIPLKIWAVVVTVFILSNAKLCIDHIEFGHKAHAFLNVGLILLTIGSVLLIAKDFLLAGLFLLITIIGGYVLAAVKGWVSTDHF